MAKNKNYKMRQITSVYNKQWAEQIKASFPTFKWLARYKLVGDLSLAPALCSFFLIKYTECLFLRFEELPLAKMGGGPVRLIRR